jgi:LysM repeat protein
VAAEVEYRVQSGDTLWSIASKFGVSMARLQEYNSISNAAYIRVGQLIKIPTSTSEVVAEAASTPTATATPEPVVKTYTIKSGDTLWGIARKLGVSSTALAELNNINNANYIRVGQVLKVPS